MANQYENGKKPIRNETKESLQSISSLWDEHKHRIEQNLIIENADVVVEVIDVANHVDANNQLIGRLALCKLSDVNENKTETLAVSKFIFDACAISWKRYNEKKPVPHWPCVKKHLRKKGNDEASSISRTLYATEECARENNGENFIRLLIEYPPAMVVPSDREWKILKGRKDNER